jgi:hypothetical protein
MLAALIIWFYILIIFAGYGAGMMAFLHRIFRVDATERASFPLLILLGFSAANLVSAVLSLFMPLSLMANIILAAGALTLLYKCRSFIQFPDIKTEKMTLVLFILSFLIVLENVTHIPANSDTILYHSQAIHWVEQYRAVPGLGNLHARLAFNSNWLVLNALFSFAFLGIQSFHVLPGIFLLVVLLHFLPGASGVLRGEVSPSNLFKTLLVPLSFHVWASEISSPGTDLPTSLLIWLVVALWLEVRERPSFTFRILIFILSVTAVTIKLSAFPLLIFPAYDVLLSLNQKHWRNVFAFIILGFAILFPWMARNYIISGYWAYPIPALIPVSPKVDWQMPTKVVQGQAESIQLWARQFTVKEKTSPYPWQWMPFWLSRLTLFQRIIFWTPILSLPIYGLAAIWDKRFRNLTYAVIYAGILFWLFSAPGIRFGYGFLIAGVLLVLVPPLIPFLRFSITGKLFNIGIVLYLSMILFLSFEPSTFSSRIIAPAPYVELPTRSCDLANAVIECSQKYNACGYSAFPCAPKADPEVELRGSDWQDGFRTIQP